MPGAPILALFDCDGTLVDSQAHICLAVERAFEDHGLPQPGNNAARRVVGLSLVEAMRKLHPDGEAAMHAQLAECYRGHYLGMRNDGVLEEPLYPGMADLLARLAAEGWTLGVATGKSLRGLERVLARHGLSEYFTTLQVADHHPSKPHPSMVFQAMAETGAETGGTVVIGDTMFDMEMAKAAGVPAIGVDWGYHEPDELREAGAAEIARDAGHLETLLAGYRGR